MTTSISDKANAFFTPFFKGEMSVRLRSQKEKTKIKEKTFLHFALLLYTYFSKITIILTMYDYLCTPRAY